jgi:hypothetical protein
MMAMIYRAADEILIWLGDEDETSATEIRESFNTIDDLWRRVRSAGQGIPGRQKLLSITKYFIEENLSGVSQRWQALARIFALLWFSRAWIIQEAVFANNTWPWFYWGRESRNRVLISGVAEAFNLASRFQILPVDSSDCGFKTISSIEGL